jgi:sigma-B regulation protein RsbU (phosphoserine phosphatase)
MGRPGANLDRTATSSSIQRTMRRGQKTSMSRGRVKDFYHEFTEGLTTGELRRLFQRDAAQAYRVLTREQDLSHEPPGKFKRFFFRAKVVFLGLSYKLSPARRVLFAVSIIAALLGLVRFRAVVQTGEVSVGLSPIWFLASVAGLTFLLALELVDRVLVRDELEVARQLQRDLLPSTAPDVPGYRIAHSYRTANEIGGDYYDFLPLPDGRIVLVIGDASGHGMAAGLLMAIANAALKLAVEVDPEPARVAALLNRVLWRTGDRRAFMSLFYGLLTPETGHIEYVCAGHPFPLLRRASGEVEELGRGGLPLGIRESVEVARADVTLGARDLLLLYSDGLPESVNAAGEAFGFERLRTLLRAEAEPQAIHDRFLRALEAHVAGEALTDDVSIVVVSRV